MATTKKTTTTKHAGGRPPSLTPAVQELILTNRRLGISWERSCRLAGVTWVGVKNWIARGEAARSKSPNDRDAFDNKCLEFLAAKERAEDEWIRRCETVLQMSMRPGSSNDLWDQATDADKDRAVSTAKFKLTHQAPDEYSTKTTSELTGKDGAPLSMAVTNGDDVFKVLLEAVAIEDAE